MPAPRQHGASRVHCQWCPLPSTATKGGTCGRVIPHGRSHVRRYVRRSCIAVVVLISDSSFLPVSGPFATRRIPRLHDRYVNTSPCCPAVRYRRFAPMRDMQSKWKIHTMAGNHSANGR
jgi:hypothetical protein